MRLAAPSALVALSLAQAQEEYERRLKEEMAAKTIKEREIEQLVGVHACMPVPQLWSSRAEHCEWFLSSP